MGIKIDARTSGTRVTKPDGDVPPELTRLAGRLERAMVPVDPTTAFVHSLGRELVEAARRRQRVTRRWRRGLLVGAAAVGSLASVVGVIVTVLLLRRRSVQPSPVTG